VKKIKRNRNRIVLLTLFFIWILFITNQQLVLSATDTASGIYNIPLFTKDEALGSPYNSAYYYLKIQPGMQLLDRCFVNLSYSH